MFLKMTYQWFSTILMLRPFNIVPYAVVNTNYDMGAHVSWCTWSGHSFLWSQFFASVTWVPEVKLGQTRLCKYLCLLGHLARPQINKHYLEYIFLVQRKELNEERHEGIC